MFGGGNCAARLDRNQRRRTQCEIRARIPQDGKYPGRCPGPARHLSAQGLLLSRDRRVLVKKLRNLHNNTIMQREKEYSSRLVESKWKAISNFLRRSHLAEANSRTMKTITVVVVDDSALIRELLKEIINQPARIGSRRRRARSAGRARDDPLAQPRRHHAGRRNAAGWTGWTSSKG